MKFSKTYLITFFLLVLIPYAISFTFNLRNIDKRNLNNDIDTFGDGPYISDDGIHLTPDKSSMSDHGLSGWATYHKHLHLWDSRTNELASFSTSFTFVINSNGSQYYGDGLTFFLAQNNSVFTPGGGMGLPTNYSNIISRYSFVAVEFDTFWNRGWDPLDSSNTPIGDHVGISIGSLRSVMYQKWLSNVSGGGVCQAWITYDSVSKILSVNFTGYLNNRVIHQDGLAYMIDLRKELPEWVIFGFSAGTGVLFQKNDVRSWSFNGSDLEVDKKNEQPPNPQIPSPDPVARNYINVGLIIGLPLSVTSLGFILYILSRMRKKKRNAEEAEENGFDVEMNDKFEKGTGSKRLSYNELARSTCDFAETEKLGEGGFGGVYRGFLQDSKTHIAVKRVSKTSKQGVKEYTSEVMIISQLRHKNLVQLIGWCHEKSELLLVYEYMENGSLDSHLFRGKRGKSLLTWHTRFKIVHGLASALLYLHEEWDQCVLHRDIKSSNVMLDSNFNAKLGDFGLAKLVDHEKGSQTTVIAGTLGYMAPECVVTGKASKESDVFSFGVVALEIACGRKPIDHKVQENEIRLLEWVWELYGTGNLLEAADARLGPDFEEEHIKRLMIVGLWCVYPDSEHRPSIRQAIQALKSEVSLPILPPKMPVATYLTPSMVQNEPPSVVSNRDSSNQSVLVGR